MNDLNFTKKRKNEEISESNNAEIKKIPTQTDDCLVKAKKHSAQLMYAEYMKEYNTNAEQICKKLEKKPVFEPLGESPLLQKYSGLLKKFEEGKEEYLTEEECPTGCEKDLPLVEINVLLQKEDFDSYSCEDSDSSEDSDNSTSDEDSKSVRRKVEIIDEKEE